MNIKARRVLALQLLCLVWFSTTAGHLAGGNAAEANDRAVIGNGTAGAAEDRVSLSAGETQALSLLNSVRPGSPSPVFLFTDPNKDPDDLNVLVESKYLQQHGFIDLKAVVTTLGNRNVRTIRAKFSRSVLDQLGLNAARVGVGVDYGFEVVDESGTVDEKVTAGREHDHAVFLETPLLDPMAEVESDGVALLKSELETVSDHSAVLLVNAGMADLAELLRSAPELVQQKTARVVIMGGVDPQLDDRGFAVADHRAYNNSTHQASADYVYSRVQELGVPLVIVNKEATYAAAVPRSFYESIAATRHPIGVYLREQQKLSLKQLWSGIHEGHLPPALTPTWFLRTFTDIELQSPEGKRLLAAPAEDDKDFEAIWSHVNKLNLYDPLALLAATPGAADLLFTSEVPSGAKSNVQVIGKNSIKNPQLIKDLLAAISIESLGAETVDKR